MRLFHWALLAIIGLPSLAEASPAGDAAMRFHQQVKAVGRRATSARLRGVIDQGADLDGIHGAALEGVSGATPTQQRRLAAAGKDLLRHRFHSTIRDLPPVTERIRERATQVDATVTLGTKEGAKTVEIDYVMRKVDDTWRVRDVITEPVSLAKNYKYEINRLSKKGETEKVIKALEQQVRALDAAGD